MQISITYTKFTVWTKAVLYEKFIAVNTPIKKEKSQIKT